MRLVDFINTRESFSQVGRINGAAIYVWDM